MEGTDTEECGRVQHWDQLEECTGRGFALGDAPCMPVFEFSACMIQNNKKKQCPSVYLVFLSCLCGSVVFCSPADLFNLFGLIRSFFLGMRTKDTNTGPLELLWSFYN